MGYVYFDVKYKDESWLREAYRDHSIQEMADMIDCSTATIHKYMNEYGIERPDKNAAKDGQHKDRDWLREKYVTEELSQKEIGDMAGVHKGTIKYWLDKHDIDIRSKSEAAEIRAERHPHTTEAGAKALKEAGVNAWELFDEDEREAFRDRLSQERTGDGNPMYDRTGEDHPNWKPNKPEARFYKNKRWREARKRALDRDGGECVVCGTEENLHVHHIYPVSAGGPRFELNNLVTLCRTHHFEYEGLYVRPDTR